MISFLLFLLLHMLLLIQQFLCIVSIGFLVGFTGEQGSFQCHQNDTQVQKNGIILDIHEIHFQFIIGQGIIQTGDLCITSQSCLYLKPELEFRHGFLVFLRQFRTLRTGAHHRHIAAV